jgi:O-antigen/teichoic acid export membrane protein
MNLASNTFWVFTDKLIKLVGGLLVGVLVTRYLGPEQFGELNNGTLLLAVCVGFVPQALKYYYIKELGSDDPQAPVHRAQAGAQLILFTVLGYAAALLALWAKGGHFVVGWLLISAAAIYPLSTIKYGIESESDFRQITIIENLGFVVSGLLKWLVIYLQLDIVMMAWAYFADTVISAACMAYVVRQRPELSGMGAAWQALRSGQALGNIRITGPLFLTTLIAIVYVKVDQIIVSYLLPAHDFGIYAAGARISEISGLFPVVVTTVAYPILLNLYYQQRERYVATFRAVLSLMIYGGLAYTLLIQLFAPEIVVLLFKAPFKDASQPLSVMSLAATTTFMGYLWHSWMILENQGALLLKSNILCIALSCTAAWLLVPSMGMTGAALGTVLAFIASAIYGFASYKPGVFFRDVADALLHPIKHLQTLAATHRLGRQA